MEALGCRPNHRDSVAVCDLEGGPGDVHADREGWRGDSPQERTVATADVENTRPRRNVREGVLLPTWSRRDSGAGLTPPDFLVELARAASMHPASRNMRGMFKVCSSLSRDCPPMGDVSVVITVKDDPQVIACVEGVLGQTASFPFDVVIVDNGSSGETPRLLRDRFASDPRVKLLTSGGNLSEAWNVAARTTEAAILVRIDADAVPLAGWLEALVRPIMSGAADWTAGPVSGANPSASVVARYYHERTEAYSRRLARDPQLRDAVPSWNVAYRRFAIEAAGWYDPWQASSVDWDLHKRLGRTGSRGLFVAQARAIHHHPTTLREFARKEAWYRTGQYQMALKYGFREMASGFYLPLAYGLLLLLAVTSLVWAPLAWIALVFLVALLAKHWIEGVRESDPLWYYRALFRPIEGVAGLVGLVRGILRYGVRRPTRA